MAWRQKEWIDYPRQSIQGGSHSAFRLDSDCVLSSTAQPASAAGKGGGGVLSGGKSFALATDIDSQAPPEYREVILGAHAQYSTKGRILIPAEPEPTSQIPILQSG